jgi:hypothetical protein
MKFAEIIRLMPLKPPTDSVAIPEGIREGVRRGANDGNVSKRC